MWSGKEWVHFVVAGGGGGGGGEEWLVGEWKVVGAKIPCPKTIFNHSNEWVHIEIQSTAEKKFNRPKEK